MEARVESPKPTRGAQSSRSKVEEDVPPAMAQSSSHTISIPKVEKHHQEVNTVQIWRFWFEVGKAAL